MRSLPEVQRAFGESLRSPQEAVLNSPGFGAYVGNVYANWGKALASAYPIVRKIVGDAFFEDLGRAYARSNPSASGDLNEFGVRFPAFAGEFQGTLDLPYLPDVAQMEWLAHRAYFAADAPEFDPVARLVGLTTGDPTSIRLQCVPGSALLVSEWPLARIWEVHQEDYRGSVEIDFRQGAERVLVCRRGWHAEVFSIAPGDHAFLAQAACGSTLGDALETACAMDPQFDPADALARWVRKGIVTL